MKLSELHKWRNRAPFLICTFCIIVWIFVVTKDVHKTELYVQTAAPILATIATFFYVGTDFRDRQWSTEVDRYVGEQIRQTLLNMVPEDLAITEAEKKELVKAQIFRNLTGVFWEAVDGNDKSKSLKEHFYSNGAVYSTSIDVFIICGFSGLVFFVASIVTRDSYFALAGLALTVIAVLSKWLVLPRRRENHLSLSREQLELLDNEGRAFIEGRFREIVGEWRHERPF